MMTGVRNLLWLLPLALLVGWPLWGGPLTSFLAPRGGFDVAAQPRNGQVKSFSMDGVFFTQLKRGVKDWQITTDHLYTADDPDLMQMEQVEAAVFEKTQEKFHITSQNGVYDTKKEVLTLEKDVRVRSDEGFVVTSSRLRYYDKQRAIKTDTPVHIVGKDMDIRGKGLVYDLNRATYEVGGRVKVQSW